MVLSSSPDGFMYRVRWPCASRSMSNTLCPNSASAAPRFTAVVVLPTPPFCIATAIVRAKIAPSLTQGGADRPTGWGPTPGGLGAVLLQLAAMYGILPIVTLPGGATFGLTP